MPTQPPVQANIRRASVLLIASIGVAHGVFVPAPTSAASGDVWPRGVRYCATTHANHGTWPGFGPAIDMNAPKDDGMPVRAPGNGTAEVKTSGGAWGNSIIWTNTKGTERIHFAHLKGFAKTGRVESGGVVGYIGRSGRADSTHLHASAWRGKAVELVLSGVVVKANRCYTSIGPLAAHAPTTRVTPTASKTPYKNWTRGSWRVQLKCSDDWSGCAKTMYSVNGGDPSRYAKAFSLDKERRYTVKYASRDRAGHSEAWRSTVLKIDRTVPRVTVDQPPPSVGRFHLVAHASDPSPGSRSPASGVTKVTFSVCPAGGGDCGTFAGRREGSTWVADVTMAPGNYVVRAKAKDAAYNAGMSNAVTASASGS